MTACDQAMGAGAGRQPGLFAVRDFHQHAAPGEIRRGRRRDGAACATGNEDSADLGRQLRVGERRAAGQSHAESRGHPVVGTSKLFAGRPVSRRQIEDAKTPGAGRSDREPG
jgi:hypothetical protein